MRWSIKIAWIAETEVRIHSGASRRSLARRTQSSAEDAEKAAGYDAERPWTSSLQKLEPPLVQTKDLVPIFTSCLRTKLWRNRENVILHEDNCTAIR